MAGSNTLQLNEDNFQTQVIEHDGTVLVDFWAEWCPPCRAIGPVIDALADDFAGDVPVGKVDVDANQQLATKYGISSIPALVVFTTVRSFISSRAINPKTRWPPRSRAHEASPLLNPPHPARAGLNVGSGFLMVILR